MPLFGPPNIEKLKEKGDVKALVKAVGHWKACHDAAVALADLGDPSAVQPLIATLKHEDPNVRCAAAEALGELGDPRAVQALIALLGAKWPPERRKAGEAVGKLGKEAVEALIATLAADDININRDTIVYAQWEAVAILAKFGDASAVQAILVFADKRRSFLSVASDREGAAGEAAVDSLFYTLKDKDGEVRKKAAEALAGLGEAIRDYWIAITREAVRDYVIPVPTGAAEQSGRGIRGPLDVGLSEEMDVIRACSRIRHVVVDLLVLALESDDWNRERGVDSLAVVQELERIGGPEAQKALTEYRARHK